VTETGRRPLLALILGLSGALGLWALARPFLEPAATAAARAADAARAAARAEDAALVFLLLGALCAVTVVAALETRRADARTVAALGVLLALNAVLRLVPGPAGFSATFLLPILCGYALGSAFGFLLGALTMLVSAVLASGLGPWLPFQMLAAGWVGLASGWLPDLGRRPRLELASLAAWGAFAGLAYGAVVNLWFWPFLTADAAGAAGVTWEPGLGLRAAAARYGAFYLATSLWWDLGRSAGNAALVLFAGRPVLRLLRRFAERFRFSVEVIE
jgi:energy-coupling factor transport system substrate-specific component